MFIQLGATNFRNILFYQSEQKYVMKNCQTTAVQVLMLLRNEEN